MFVQPFGVGGPGGGPRILRTLIRAVPLDALSVCASPEAPPRTDVVEERHTGSRPRLGRLEHTRLAPSLTALDVAYGRRLARNLRGTAVQWRAPALHSGAPPPAFLPGVPASPGAPPALPPFVPR